MINLIDIYQQHNFNNLTNPLQLEQYLPVGFYHKSLLGKINPMKFYTSYHRDTYIYYYYKVLLKSSQCLQMNVKT